MRGRSGTIIVALVMALGLGVGGVGAWWVVHARPRPGDFIDVLATNEGAIVVRHEQSSDHAFLEVYDGSRLRWRGMVPRYAGHPLNPFFVCDLERLILERRPRLWLHGHTHNSVRTKLGETSLFCNPFGYVGIELNPEFEAQLIVDV